MKSCGHSDTLENIGQFTNHRRDNSKKVRKFICVVEFGIWFVEKFFSLIFQGIVNDWFMIVGRYIKCEILNVSPYLNICFIPVILIPCFYRF